MHAPPPLAAARLLSAHAPQAPCPPSPPPSPSQMESPPPQAYQWEFSGLEGPAKLVVLLRPTVLLLVFAQVVATLTKVTRTRLQQVMKQLKVPTLVATKQEVGALVGAGALHPASSNATLCSLAGVRRALKHLGSLSPQLDRELLHASSLLAPHAGPAADIPSPPLQVSWCVWGGSAAPDSHKPTTTASQYWAVLWRACP